MGTLPRIAITMGDPAGIGPEIILKALSKPQPWEVCQPLVVGAKTVLERARDFLGMGSLALKEVSGVAEAAVAGEIPVLPGTEEELGDVRWGRVDPRCGRAQVDFIRKAVDLAMAGQVQALVTAPINKVGLKLAGVGFPGHTEMLASWTKARRFAMMLVGARLKVVPVTLHCSLREAIEGLSRKLIQKTALLTQEALVKWFGIRRPTLAVSGLNPHAGEDGLFGREEETIIAPAVRSLRRRGVQIHGPISPDAVFPMAAEGAYDVVLAMYHDQGLIPLKLLERRQAVNLTLGLPIIRTSVDHGTAYDIAGKGLASDGSLLAAIELAARLAREVDGGRGSSQGGLPG